MFIFSTPGLIRHVTCLICAVLTRLILPNRENTKFYDIDTSSDSSSEVFLGSCSNKSCCPLQQSGQASSFGWDGTFSCPFFISSWTFSNFSDRFSVSIDRFSVSIDRFSVSFGRFSNNLSHSLPNFRWSFRPSKWSLKNFPASRMSPTWPWWQNRQTSVDPWPEKNEKWIRESSLKGGSVRPTYLY